MKFDNSYDNLEPQYQMATDETQYILKLNGFLKSPLDPWSKISQIKRIGSFVGYGIAETFLISYHTNGRALYILDKGFHDLRIPSVKVYLNPVYYWQELNQIVVQIGSNPAPVYNHWFVNNQEISHSELMKLRKIKTLELLPEHLAKSDF